MSIITKARRYMSGKKAAAAAALTLATVNVQAALPTTTATSQTTANSTDYIKVIKGYAFDIGIAAGLILGTIAFLVVAKNAIGTYGEIANGKKTWGDLAMHGGMGVLLLAFCVFMLNEAAKVLAA